MDVVGHAVDGQDLRFKAVRFATYQPIHEGFKLWREQWFAVLGRPDDVVEELPVGHESIVCDSSPGSQSPIHGAWLCSPAILSPGTKGSL